MGADCRAGQTDTYYSCIGGVKGEGLTNELAVDWGPGILTHRLYLCMVSVLSYSVSIYWVDRWLVH